MTDSVGSTERGTGASPQGHIRYLRRLVLTLVPIPERDCGFREAGEDATFGEVAPGLPVSATANGFRNPEAFHAPALAEHTDVWQGRDSTTWNGVGE